MSSEMNTSSITGTQNRDFHSRLSQVIPESGFGKIVFWGALPLVFLFLTIEVSFLSHSPFSSSLPFLAIAGGLSLLRWRLPALIGTHAALIALFFFSEGGLKDYGILVAFALDFFILYFSFLEVESLFLGLSQFGKERVKELNQSLALLSQTQQEKEEQGRTLQEEIQRLKEEAEQRRIEMSQEAKRISLIQSEIELLTAQKEVFVNEAKKAKAIFAQMEELKNYIAALTEVQERLIHEKEVLRQQAEASERENLMLRQDAAEWIQEKSKGNELKAHLAELRAENATLLEFQKRSENLEAQLTKLQRENDALIEMEEEQRVRADEQKRVLEEQESALKAELSNLKVENAALVQAQEEQIARTYEEKRVLEQQQSVLKAELAELKGEKGVLTHAREELEAVLLSNQESILILQQHPLVKTHDLRALEGLHKQLRNQFEEKSQVLSLTRKELYETQGRLLVLQREGEERVYEPQGEGEAVLEKLVDQLVQEISALEEEVLVLEEIVSNRYQ